MKFFNKNMILIGMISAILFSPITALAYDETDAQTIKQDISKMHDAMKNKDGKVFVAMMPEPILKQIAQSLGISLVDTKELLSDMATTGMSDSGIKFKANLARIQTFQSKTGRDYVFIPITTTTDRIIIKGKMFGVKDNGKWSYITWQDRYKSLVKKAYPDIKKLP